MFVLKVAGMGLSYLLQVLLARWMGAAPYGTYTYILAWASTIALFSCLGLPAAVLRFIPAYEAKEDLPHLRGLLRGGVVLVLGISTGIALVATALILALDAYRGLPQPLLLLLGAWGIPVLALLKTQAEMLRAARRIVWAYAPALLLRPLLVGTAAYLILEAYRTLSSTTVLALTVGALGLIMVLQHYVLHWTFAPNLREIVPAYAFRPWLRTALPLLLSTMFVFIVSQADLLMLGMILGDEVVGPYHAGARTASVISLPLVAVNSITAPTIALEYARGRLSDLNRLVNWSTRWIFWPSLILSVVVIAFAEPILGLFGPAFTDAATALRVLSLGHLVNAGAGPVGYLMDLTGHQDESARVYGASALLNIILNGVGIPLLGFLGAAIATASTLILRNLWLYVLVVRRLGVHASIFTGVRPRPPIDS